MKIKFLGTKGEINIRTKKHFRHSTLLITHNRKKLLIDFGVDWQNKLNQIKPDWILITHAHPDHAWGLKPGTDIPVFVSKDTAKLIKKYPLSNLNIFEFYKKFKLGPFTILPYPVIHSVLALAGGFKITQGKFNFIYNPDLIYIKKIKHILKNVDLYIGDGATIDKNLVRKTKGQLVGHTTVRTQINWCAKYNIPWFIVSHCGSQIVKASPKELKRKLDKYKKTNVKVQIAYDGLEIKV